MKRREPVMIAVFCGDAKLRMSKRTANALKALAKAAMQYGHDHHLGDLPPKKRKAKR